MSVFIAVIITSMLMLIFSIALVRIAVEGERRYLKSAYRQIDSNYDEIKELRRRLAVSLWESRRKRRECKRLQRFIDRNWSSHELEADWPDMPDLPDGVDMFANYPIGGEPEP